MALTSIVRLGTHGVAMPNFPFLTVPPAVRVDVGLNPRPELLTERKSLKLLTESKRLLYLNELKNIERID